MKKCYLGVDIGSISTKGVVIDDDNNIIASEYLWTEGNPVGAVKRLVSILKKQVGSDYALKGIGTTGSARKLIGLMLGTKAVKNEITAHAVGTGAFLSSQAKRIGVDINEFGILALESNNPVKIAARCTVFAESDLIHKAQSGYEIKDIVAGLCKSIVLNYLNNVGKGKKIKAPIIFQGGVSKNKGVVKYFKEVLGEDIIVDENSHLMGALGIAIISKKYETDKIYSFDVNDIKFVTKGHECTGCTNNCEVLKIYKNDTLVDTWGNRCPRGVSS